MVLSPSASNLPTFPYLMLIISQCWQSIVLEFFHERSASSDFFFLKSRSWTDVNLTDISNLQPKIKRKTSIKKIWSLFSYTSLSSRGLPKWSILRSSQMLKINDLYRGMLYDDQHSGYNLLWLPSLRVRLHVRYMYMLVHELVNF